MSCVVIVKQTGFDIEFGSSPSGRVLGFVQQLIDHLCIQCHINNMALDAPTISCQKCANPRALLIQLENVKRESIPDEVGGGLRQLRGAVHVDPVPGTVALQNEKENR